MIRLIRLISSVVLHVAKFVESRYVNILTYR